MDAYDPLRSPDPQQWLELDEGKRISLILDYHEGIDDDLPSPQAHAAIHAVVESQVALGDEIPVRAALDRLMREGLDRHDAIHAIGCVLAEQMADMCDDEGESDDPNEAYFKKLSQFTADDWLNYG